MADDEDNALLSLSKDVASAFVVVGLVFVFGFLVVMEGREGEEKG